MVSAVLFAVTTRHNHENAKPVNLSYSVQVPHYLLLMGAKLRGIDVSLPPRPIIATGAVLSWCNGPECLHLPQPERLTCRTLQV